MNLPLILASSSPARKHILNKLQIPFSCITPDVDETTLPGEAIDAYVLRLAIAKANKAAEQLPAPALIIGCDSACVLGGKIVSKPGTHSEAAAQLKAASGRIVSFYTGLTLLNSKTNIRHERVIKIQVHFKKLSPATIEAYLQKDQPYHCAGSIKAEGLGIVLLKKMPAEDPNSLVGLPLIALIEMLEREHHPLL